MHTNFPEKDYIDKIVDKYSDLVYKLAFARTRQEHYAEEVYQEVFLRYIKAKPNFNDENHEKAWFIRVTINCSNSFFQILNKFKYEEIKDDIKSENKEEEISDLKFYLDKLPLKYRTVIHLFYYEDMKSKDIATYLNKKESTIRMQLKRGREMMKELLKGDEDYV